MVCSNETARPNQGGADIERKTELKQLSAAQQAKADRIRAQKQDKAAEVAAKKAERKAKKLAQQADGSSSEQGPPDRFLKRDWHSVHDAKDVTVNGKTVSILSWNMLAQALVRRELFPGSDFLKVKDRVPQLMKEVLHYDPDIACLQEVDRLGDHLPSLSKSHGHTSFIGYADKPHGLLIAHKTSVFDKVGHRGIRLDELPIKDDLPLSFNEVITDSIEDGIDVDKSTAHVPVLDETPDGRERTRRATGLSRCTRNVGLFVALKFKDSSDGIIVGTTHLFWHPKHVYERVRQTGILIREAQRFRREGGDGAWREWPLVLAGDFNAQPVEATYRILMGIDLTDEQKKELARSTVIHKTVDDLYKPEWERPLADQQQTDTGTSTPREANDSNRQSDVGEGDEDESQQATPDEEDEDKVIKNCRLATQEDGLASLEDLVTLIRGQNAEDGERPISAYGQIGGLLPSEKGKQYGDRDSGVYSGETGTVVDSRDDALEGTPDQETRIKHGHYEPMWTNFTPLWRLAIDYIFLLPPEDTSSNKPRPIFKALLSTHSTETLGSGLPKMGISASDHVAIGARLVIPLQNED
ncbi:RNA exonuclease ngl2 [Microbotryomycetes sp. JL221]|nr:RNA exonuclease ngl2 [Microbotryomycetes sp. JL221]